MDFDVKSLAQAAGVVLAVLAVKKIIVAMNVPVVAGLLTKYT